LTYLIFSLLALSFLFPKFGLSMFFVVMFIYKPDFMIWIVGLSIIGIIITVLVAPKEPYVPKKLVWRGKMKCNDCRYIWMSRRNNPPAKCANCKSNYISIVEEL